MPWLTNKETGGHFNTDWLEEEERTKYRQIASNKQEADALNNKSIQYEENATQLNGKPGVYNLFRSGNLSAPNGMIFLAAKRREAEYYGTAGRDLDTYQLEVKNPLVIDAGGDVEAVQKAWKALHPDKELKLGRNGLQGNKWQQLDKQNSIALQKSGYDALMYRIDGEVKEVQIPGKQASRLDKKETTLHAGSVTLNETLPKAREIAHSINESGETKSKEAVIKDIIKSLDTSKYDIKYLDWMDRIVIEPKTGDGLIKSRGTIYMRVLVAANGRVFVSASGGDT